MRKARWPAGGGPRNAIAPAVSAGPHGAPRDVSVAGQCVFNANDLPRIRVLPCLISAFRIDPRTVAPSQDMTARA